MLGKCMSFSVGKIKVFLSLLCLLVLSSTNAYAAFPDLGVVGDHRLMTVVGFAQQDYYFDLFKYGGLQTLALTFALIGGLLLLLIPKNHNIVTIGSYLLLVFILIVAPNPSTQSLFFYPLGDVPERWNCPVPPSDTGLSMEEFCTRGIDSISGNIADTLSDYTMSASNVAAPGNTSGFGAFVPQLVTIHFFTAVERTLLEALWVNTRNATHPGDLMGIVDANDVVSDAVSNNPNIKYYNSVYSTICEGQSDLLNVGDFTALPQNIILEAAMHTFTFADAVAANEIFYNTARDRPGFYPVRAATAKIYVNDYVKSLTYPASDTSRTTIANSIRGEMTRLGLAGPLDALQAYKEERIKSTETLKFPHSDHAEGSGRAFNTNIFKALITSDDDYSDSYEPDPYDYTAKTTASAARIPDGVTPHAANSSAAIWLDSDVSLRPNPAGFRSYVNGRPTGRGAFYDSISGYRDALSDQDSTSHQLAIAMSEYPVQLFIPYVIKSDPTSVHFGTPDATNVAGSPVRPAWQRLLPRTLGTAPTLSGTGGGGVVVPTPGATQFTTSVQSCLDFAALIHSRRYYALEELGYLDDIDMDLRMPLNTGELISLVEMPVSPVDGEEQNFQNTLAEKARVALQKQGCVMDDAGTGWVGCSRGSTAPAPFASDLPKAVCESMLGFACTMERWAKTIFHDFQKSWESAQSGNFASITNSQNGATTHGGANSYSAAAGDFIVKYGLMVASFVQGFVYGAYMKLMPVIIGYGIAITLFMTPFVFLMGIAIPMQARSVLVAPIVAIAFLKTVSVALVVVDNAFVSLMFWVERVNVSDPQLYKAMLVMAHLTASVSLFSLAGLLLFGLNDPGSFVKHLSSMDKAGQVSFQEAVAYGAAPIAATKMATGLAKKGVGAVTGAGGAAVEKGGKLAASSYMKDGRNMSEGMQETVSNMATSTGLMGAVHTAIGGKAFARGLAAQADKADAKEKFKDNLSDNFTVDGKTLSATAKAEKLADRQAAITEDAAIVRGRRREIAEAGTIDQVRAQSTALLDQQMRRHGDSANTKPNGTGPKGSHAVESGQKELESQAKKVAEALHGTAAAIDAAGEKARKAIAQSYERGTNKEDFVRDVDQVKGVGFSGMKESIAREVLGDDKVNSGRIETSKSGERYYIADWQKVKSDKQRQAQEDLIKSKLDTL